MNDLKILLQNKCKDAKRIAILGIGSDLRGDDAVGMLISQKIEAYRKRIKEEQRLQVFFAATAPESFTGAIKRFNPTHLFIIDAAEIKKTPGEVILLDPQTVGGITFSTHSLPLKVMIDYLLVDLKCEIMVIGIQPKNLDFGSCLSAEVKKAAQDISKVIKDIIKSVLKPKEIL